MKNKAVISDETSDGSFTYHVEGVLTITMDCGVITCVDTEGHLTVNQLKNHLDNVRNHLATMVQPF